MSSTSSIYGFTSSGIDVNTLVSSLMQVERAPIGALQTRQSAVKKQVSALDLVKTRLDALTTYASSLDASSFSKAGATVSNPSAVTATVTGTAMPGSLVFGVEQLASARGVRSIGTLPATTAKVTDDALLALSTTTAPLGISGLRAGGALVAGNLTMQVTQATTAATKVGTAALAGSTVIAAGTNDTVELEIDGVARTVTIPAGTHSAASLVAAVQSGLQASGGGATASLDTGGRLRIGTLHEGSAATIRVTGGTGLTDIGLGVDAIATGGGDGTVTVGTTVTTVTSARSGEVVSVGAGAGTLDLTLSGGLRAGSSVVAVVSAGNGSLASVVSAVNGAGVGASAAAVKVADNQYRLQISSSQTGVSRTLAIGDGAFAAAGGMIDTSPAQDARIVVGTGPGAYDVLASGNTFTDVLPGVTLTATATTTSPVTVGVARSDGAVADAVGKLVDLANAVLKEIATQTKYDASTKSAAALSGDTTVRRLASELRNAVSGLVTGSASALAANVGIASGRDGTFSFDRAKFTEALAADPGAVARLFTRGGTGTGNAVFAAASTATNAGSYDIVVTSPATRATTGQVLTGGTPTSQRIGIRVGATTVTYDTAPGATASEIVAGLNAVLGEAAFGVVAEVDGSGIRLAASSFGTAGTFEANLDLTGTGVWAGHTGSDVAGTIDGVAAIGVGRRLSLTDLAASEARGLAFDIADGFTGTVDDVMYEPGIAARLTILGRVMTDSNGQLTTSAASYEKKIESYTDQIERYEDRMTVREANLKRQWTAMQSLLSSLENQSDWLAGMAAKSSSSS